MYRDKRFWQGENSKKPPVRQSRPDKQRKYSAAIRKATGTTSRDSSTSLGMTNGCNITLLANCRVHQTLRVTPATEAGR